MRREDREGFWDFGAKLHGLGNAHGGPTRLATGRVVGCQPLGLRTNTFGRGSQSQHAKRRRLSVLPECRGQRTGDRCPPGSCWEQYLQYYASGQSDQRLEHARTRVEELSGRRSPTTTSSSGGSSGGAPESSGGLVASNGNVAPSGSSGTPNNRNPGPGTTTTIADAGTSTSTSSSATATGTATDAGSTPIVSCPPGTPPVTSAVTPSANRPLPGATCGLSCRNAWVGCNNGCSFGAEASCSARCDDGYRDCMRNCF